MSRVLTAKETCERALRIIGAFPITDSAPDGEQLREALLWLDLIMAEVAGTRTLFHLIPQPVKFALEPGVFRYPLKTALGSAYPEDGIQFPIGAWLVNAASGEAVPLPIVKRETWQRETTLPQNGAPRFVHIDRLPDPTLQAYPTPTATGFELQLDFQKYAPNVAPGGVSGTTPQGAALTGYRQAWQRYLIYRLCQDLATGAVIPLAEGRIARYERTAAIALAQLEAFENEEHDNEPPIMAGYGEGPAPIGGRMSGGSHTPGAGAAQDEDGYHLIID